MKAVAPAPEASLDNPVLVEVTRGTLVESVHRGAVAVANRQGEIVASLGDVDGQVYPRSALKPVQALPLVESGACDAYGLGSEEIALACASHSGEPMHTGRVEKWLARIECTEKDLACGPHASRYEPVREAMIREGRAPTRVHNNCSGKHTGFLSVARHWQIATDGYERVDHPVQRAVALALNELAGLDGELLWGVDGCAAPNFAAPLAGLARAMARMAGPEALGTERAAASRRIVAAMTAHPELVAGTGRVCTVLMRAGDGRVAVKTGAEGVYVAMLPGPGLGIALKIDDGGGRGAETAIAALLEKMGVVAGAAVRDIARAPILNTRGARVGERRPAPALDQFASGVSACASSGT